jgi:hypothetical protein
MISLAIGILWLAIGIIILGGVIWLAIWAIGQVVPINPIIVKIVWAVFGILCLIYALMLVSGGEGGLPHPNLFR